MEWVVAVVGSLIVVVVVRDVFHTLFHPIGHGSIAPQLMKFVWWLLRLFHPDRRIASLTGPLGIALVVLTWGALAVLGWAMLYFAQMPDGFAYSSELNPAERHDVFDALYLSLVTVGTLGFGDIVPTSPVLRLLVPLEALFGFMLLTAAVSWVLQIYPALHRRRVLALQLSTLREARRAQPSLGIDSIPTDVLTGIADRCRRSQERFHPVRGDVLLSRPRSGRFAGILARVRHPTRGLRPAVVRTRRHVWRARSSQPLSTASPGSSTKSSCDSEGIPRRSSRPTPRTTGIPAERGCGLSG